MDIRSFRDMKVWQLGMSLAEVFYKTGNNFPEEERYGLTSQVRRAAVSIPSNIAEGYNCWYKREYKRFFILHWIHVLNCRLKLRQLLNLNTRERKQKCIFWKILIMSQGC